jgi:hypothetical protein
VPKLPSLQDAVLSWDASTDDSGNVAEYTVYQITDDGGEEEEIPVCDPDVAGTPGELRYCNEIFTQSEIPEPSVALGTAGIEFSSTYDLAFDLYTPPLSDTARNRPLKIFMHGGGGESEGGAAPCNEAARLGYVCISGDYRTDHTNMGFTMSEQKHAASDMLALIRFARLHATDYGIDPNKIILAGTSAGGITSMLAATTANDASFYPSSDTLVNRDNQTYQSGGIVPSWSCMVTSTFPKDVVENVPFDITIECENEGTDIWDGLNGDYNLVLQSPFTYSCTDFHTIKPRNVLNTTCSIQPGKTSGCPTLNVGLTRKNTLLMNMMSSEICVYPAPKMTLTNMRRFPGTPIAEGVAEVQIIREDTEKFVSRSQILIQNGVAEVPRVEGVNFDDSYRVVILKPGSLPVQIINVHFGKTTNSFEVPVFLPIDRNEDGKFSLSDLISSYSGN